jgi:hypothetical protein
MGLEFKLLVRCDGCGRTTDATVTLGPNGWKCPILEHTTAAWDIPGKREPVDAGAYCPECAAARRLGAMNAAPGASQEAAAQPAAEPAGARHA